MADTSISNLDPSNGSAAPPSSIPSRVDESRSTVGQFAGAMGMVTLMVGVGVRVVNANTSPPLFGKEGTLLGMSVAVMAPVLLIGLAVICLLLHAILVKEPSVRRTYGLAGYAGLTFGAIMVAISIATALGATTVVTYAIAAVLGVLLAAATAVPFVRDASSSSGQANMEAPPRSLDALNFVPRWLGAISTNKLVMQVTVASLLAAALFIAGAYFLQHVQVKDGATAPNLLPYGLTALVFGSVFLFIFAHHETVATWKDAATAVVGMTGLIAAILGLSTVMLDLVKLPDYALPHGLGLGVIGLLGLWMFILTRGGDTDLGNRAAWAMLVLGLFAVVVAGTRSVVQSNYGVPVGYLTIMLGLTYAGVGLAFASDAKLVVLTRREVTSMFYTPIAYFLMGTIILTAWVSFQQFMRQVGPYDLSKAPTLQEPVMRHYFFDLFPVIFLMIGIPMITMRTFSEEKASGTIEVLLTAPVSEIEVVLSKFLGALIFFAFSWAIWTFFPMALRILLDESFDYRPMLSTFLGMTFMGAAFVAMGNFFSSTTRDQIVSVMLTYSAMNVLTFSFFVLFDRRQPLSAEWIQFIELTSYLHQLREMVEGKVHLSYLVVHLAVMVLFLFLTIKVVEARKWK